MENIEALGWLLGNAYGELQDLCPAARTRTTSDYCVYDARGGRSAAEQVRRGGASRPEILLMYRTRKLFWAEFR